LEISSLIKTSLSEYKLLATISSKRLVSVLNSCLVALPMVFSLTVIVPSSGILSSSSLFKGSEFSVTRNLLELLEILAAL
jgi:hypothetical protein